MVDHRRMQQLVDQRRFDELLEAVSPAEIAQAWMRYQHKSRGGDGPGVSDPDWWAIELWQQSDSWADEARLREGVLALVAAARTEQDFGNVGAGVLEYAVSDDEDRLRWLEAQAAESEPFRRSLANVYVWNINRDAVAARIEAAAGVRLPRPRNWTGP